MTARRLVACLLLSVALAVPAGAQIPIEVERRRGHEMLTQVAKDLREYHVDPRLRGVDLDALLVRARRRIDSAGSLGEVFTAIAGVCLDLRDSHTRFLPPARVQVVDYGWTWQAYGDRTLVDWVDEGSQAWKAGLRPGDDVVQVAGMPLTRQNHHTVRYVVNQLRPQPGLQVVTLRGGVRETHQIAADIKTRKKRFDLENALDLYALDMQRRFAEFEAPRPKQDWMADGILYWRVPDFAQGWWEVAAQLGKLKKARTVVLDLRGNGGGLLGQAAILLKAVHDRPVTIGSIVFRDRQEALTLTPGGTPFTGELIVLVDSESASAAEVFARVVQLEKRGRIVGDRTAGLVTGSRIFPRAAGEDTIKVLYAVQVTTSDLVMNDGVRLEGVGVTPDISMVPAPEDLRDGRDPVLAHAARLVGVTIDPVKAARLSRQ